MSDQPPGFKPNYGSAIRVAQIVHWLHQHPYGITLSELSERLGISTRTLHRYLATLKDTFIDEDGEPLVEVAKPGKRGRLRFRRKSLDMEGTAYELMSLYMALDLMAFLEGTFLWDGAQEVLDRMQAALLRDHGHETSLVMKDFGKKFFHWTEAPKDYSDKNELLSQLVKALILQKNVAMVYQSPGKAAKKHELSPLSLLMYKRALYLVARRRVPSDDPNKQGELTFAVERIRSVKLMDDGFFYPSEYAPEKRFRDSFGLVRESDPRRVRLRFQKEVAQNVASRKWHHSQQAVRLESGELEVTMELDIGAEFSGWVLGYGPFVEVLEPEDFRNQIAGKLRKALDRYT